MEYKMLVFYPVQRTVHCTRSTFELFVQSGSVVSYFPALQIFANTKFREMVKSFVPQSSRLERAIFSYPTLFLRLDFKGLTISIRFEIGYIKLCEIADTSCTHYLLSGTSCTKRIGVNAYINTFSVAYSPGLPLP